MKRIFLFLIVFLFFSSVFAYSQTLDLTKWTPYVANGSKIVSLEKDKVIFKIVRESSGPKGDPSTHGYAFLLSGPISLKKDWTKIEIEGVWWRDKGPKNYNEMNLYIFSKKPHYPHKLKKGQKPNTNFIGISYETVFNDVRFEDMGVTKNKKTTKRIDRPIPTTPRPFKIIIYHRGETWWEYWEKTKDKDWEKIYEQEVSFFLEGVDYPQDEIYFKIGGWTSWEHPVECMIHFERLNLKEE